MDLEQFGIQAQEDNYHEQAIYSIALLYNRIHSELADYLKQYDLTLGKFNILMVVKHQSPKEGMRQVQISRHLILTPSNMTKLIDKLEKDGFLTRSSLEGDRRVNLIQITDKGTVLLDSLWAGYKEKLKSVSSYLSDNQSKQASELLTKWFQGLVQG